MAALKDRRIFEMIPEQQSDSRPGKRTVQEGAAEIKPPLRPKATGPEAVGLGEGWSSAAGEDRESAIPSRSSAVLCTEDRIRNIVALVL